MPFGNISRRDVVARIQVISGNHFAIARSSFQRVRNSNIHIMVENGGYSEGNEAAETAEKLSPLDRPSPISALRTSNRGIEVTL
jgi:hypothetical protein